jgi:uncharacterized protein (UPF0147 family)
MVGYVNLKFSSECTDVYTSQLLHVLDATMDVEQQYLCVNYDYDESPVIKDDCSTVVVAPVPAFANSLLQLKQFSNSGAEAVTEAEIDSYDKLVDAVAELRTKGLLVANSTVTATANIRAAVSNNVTVTANLVVPSLVTAANSIVVINTTAEGYETASYIRVQNAFNYTLRVAVVDSEVHSACSTQREFTTQPRCSNNTTAATAVTMLAPFSTGKVGPVYFRPSMYNNCNGTHSGVVYLRNNGTLLQKVELRGNSTAATSTKQCIAAVNEQMCEGVEAYDIDTAVEYYSCLQYSMQYISYNWLYYVVAATVTVLVLYLSMLHLLVEPAQTY